MYRSLTACLYASVRNVAKMECNGPERNHGLPIIRLNEHTAQLLVISSM